MKKLKKLLLSIMTLVIVLLTFGATGQVEAQSAGPMYLGIVALRSSGYGYQQGGKTVFKIAKYDSTDDTTADLNNTIYCIKAGPGFGSSDMANSTPTISTYSQKFDLRDVDSIDSTYSAVLPTGENYNKLMWILDNLYIPNYSNTSDENQDARIAFLEQLLGKEQSNWDECFEYLSDDEIDVIQQLAIWYYTNPDGEYHYEEIELYQSKLNENADYKDLCDLDGDWDRQDAAKALYLYYIDNAPADYVSTAATSEPVKLIDTNATMQTVSENYVAGPYVFNELLDVNYTINATYTDTKGNTITPTLAVKNDAGDFVSTSKTLTDLAKEGTEFYLVMPVDSGITGIEMTAVSSYNARTVTYWSVENAPTTEQPVVIVEDKEITDQYKTSIVVPQPFDLALRKFITGVNGEAITSRIPQVDVTDLAAGKATTATYNHSKEPVKVAIGDIVEYTIRVYNEAEIDGYAEEITDYLPNQLEFIVDDELNIQYGWELDPNNLQIVRTSYLSAENETVSGENLIKAFDPSTMDTLDYKDVKIRCRVVATDPMAEKITNIAVITDFTDGDGNTVTDRDSEPGYTDLPEGTDLEDYKDQEINRGEEYIPGQEDDDDFEKLMIKEFDLSLRKFITKVNTTEITTRIPEVDVTALNAGTVTTATYNHSKDPVSVAVGDTVEYTIRVYNEGGVDGYVEEITDNIPAQLRFVADSQTNKNYGWQMLDEEGNVTDDASKAVKVTTTYLSSANEENTGDNLIKAYDSTTMETLDYKDVKVVFEVVETSPMVKKITNIAEITDFTDGRGNTVTDRDSEADSGLTIPTEDKLPEYTGGANQKNDPYYDGSNVVDGTYYPGQEDDDDFEKLIMKELDLSLRKFITKVNNTEITTRIPEVDVTELKAGTATTATYNHSKDPVEVTLGAIVEYTIRVYNEGEVDGYVEEITDNIPAQLRFVADSQTNKNYGWQMLDEEGNVTDDASKAVKVTTTYLSSANEENTGDNLIKAYDSTTMETLDYKDVKVVFEVVETSPMVKKITNIAEITDFTDGRGNTVTDRDSEADSGLTIPTEDKLPEYTGGANQKNDPYYDGSNVVEGTYYPGQEDDDDFEKLIVKEFDLALRKFITAVNTTEITSRIPEVDVTPLKDGSGETAIYNHTKEPILVSNGNIVTYTIRVYNEGEIDGYAQLVKDDIPDGLEFLPENEINVEYRWVMLDEDGNETTDVDKAAFIQTDYLSKEQEETAGDNLIKAFDSSNDTLDFKDVKVAFKVVEPSTSDRTIINEAQISEDADKDGNDVDDRDSTPDVWNDGEDDQDIEKIKVQYFDLSLRKWVTQVILIENGNQTVTETGHTAEDDPEDIVKVDLKKSKLDSVVVKFKYSIRVTNEGQIAGYAKEISDYIPKGLKFVAEDNPDWTLLEENVIVTEKAKDILLQPGESTEVEVILTWENSEDNMEVMDNWAEISKDYNDFESPDVDSEPGNKVEDEDDIDDAPVLVTVQTGQIRIYVCITLIALGIISLGVVLIKKFVL